MRTFFLNNSRNRNHADEYRNAEAFYDFDRERHAHLATDLKKGDVCVVASYDESGRGTVCFKTYKFLKTETLTDSQGWPARVLLGKQQGKPVVCSKAAAARNSKYGCFFNCNGDFKRPSVIAID
jgi:hypothetical protein